MFEKYRKNVGIMVINPQKRILFCQRADMPTAWQMPQGGIEQGETIVTAGLRELREETGLNLSASSILATTSDWLYYDFPKSSGIIDKYGYIGQKQRWILVLFQGDDSQINLTAFEEEFTSFKWADKNEVQNEIVDFKRPIYQQVVEQFSSFLD